MFVIIIVLNVGHPGMIMMATFLTQSLTPHVQAAL